MKLPLRAAAWAAACATPVVLTPSPVQACSSCGCTLNSEWATQGLRTRPGWSVDLRFDAFDQTELRSGTGRVDRTTLELPNEREVQRDTRNRNTTLTVDYGFSADWGLTVQLPYLARSHSTVAEGDTELSTSRSGSPGDLRVLGRYQGFSPEHDWGVQLGLKLPTGRTDLRFNGGPQEGEPLDRGLQPGTGSTDLLLGVYRFGPIDQRFDYFAQVLLQLPLSGRDGFKPGAGVNLTAGVRYLTDGPVVPHLQINVRAERRESGEQADVENSGATLVYLSPGLTWTLDERTKVYGFVQLPVHQRVSGLQIEPKVSVSAGLQVAF